MGIEDIIGRNPLDFLPRLSAISCWYHLNKKYDLIFVDPPYKEKKIEKIFSLIKNFKILKKNGYIILHRNKKSHNYVQNNFEIIDVRSYGISKIIFYKLK